MIMQITQYGLSKAKGGWDGVGDPDTDKFLGNDNNAILNGVSCALSPIARTDLGAKDGDWVKVVFSNGFTYYRQVADSTASDLLNARVDFFNAYAFDKQMDSAGTNADVTVLAYSSLEAPQHSSNWLSWL